MAQGVDFLRLYREFQLEPGAGIDDLKRAYRRRVALVHPDRLIAKDEISQHLATEHLQNLTRLYEAGVRFHRQHGRLPGAPPTPSTDRPGAIAQGPPPPLAAKPVRRRRGWIVVALLLAGSGMWAQWTREPATDPPALPVHRRAVALHLGSAAVARGALDGLRIGMPQHVVAEVLGAPVAVEPGRWVYGPSWIRFEDGRVVEWYSSPLHPLRISKTSGPWIEP